MRHILVIDVGTSSMRGVLYNEKGQSVHILQTSYSPDYLENNFVQQNPLIWRDSLIQITSDSVIWAKSHSVTIEAISITSQRSSVIAVNELGEPLYDAIMWQDKRSYSICQELSSHLDEVYLHTGTTINPIFAAPKITWLKRNEPNIYKMAHKICVIPDYLIFLMTGRFVTDYTYGSRTSLMNIHTLTWDDDILKLFEIDKNKLCDLVQQGSIVGESTQHFQALTGLTLGTPILSAGGDQQCGALGSGVIESGSLHITTGTGSFLIASTDQPHLNLKYKTTCNASAIKGKYILDCSILTTSTIYNWFFENFYKSFDPDLSMTDTINKDAQSSNIGSRGLLLFPHFQGKGSPDWNAMAKGLFFNISLGTTRGDFARAILEGIAAEIDENVEIMRKNIGELSQISIAGGLTRSALFNQIQADFYNQPVLLPPNKETTSLGAWVSAAVELGFYASHFEALKNAQGDQTHTVFNPIKEHTQIYEQLKSRRKLLYDCLSKNGMYELFYNI